MKKFKKSTAILLTCIFGVILIVGFLFSYVPMNFGSSTFVSFSGAINVSSDIAGGIYGEFEITTENPTKKQITDSMARIKDVFEEDGYKNVNVYALGTKKIRVEVGYPRGSKTYADVYSELSNVGTGAFQLRSTQSVSDDTKIVDGGTCVDSVTVATNSDTKYITVQFNEKGKEAYKDLITNASGTIYLALGTYSQSISVSSVSTYDSLTLSDTDYKNLIKLEQRIKLGCMKVEVDGSTAVINTMSASLSAGEANSYSTVLSGNMLNFAGFTLESENQNGTLNLVVSGEANPASAFLNSNTIQNANTTSTGFVVAISALAIVLAVGIAIFACRFGYYAILIVLTMLFNSYLFVIIMALIPSVEIGLSGIISLTLGVSLIYTYSFIFATKVKNDYNQGKSLAASLENAYKKTLPNFLIGNVMLFLLSLIMFALAFGELTSGIIIFTILIALSLFTNLALIPFLIKICLSFEGFGTKLFMLKKHADLTESASLNTEEKEAE